MLQEAAFESAQPSYITMYFISYIMIVRFFIVFMLVHEVFPQVTVEGVVGGSSVLPCSSSEPKIQSMSVYWRHDESKNVYDIINGKSSLETQEPQYKNRSATFPEKYSEGNFSLKLTDLQNTDAGEYSCFIVEDGKIQKVELLIKEKSAEDKSNPAEGKSNPEEDKHGQSGNHGAQTEPEKIVIMSLLSVSILLCI